jgi:hypothetical protein
LVSGGLSIELRAFWEIRVMSEPESTTRACWFIPYSPNQTSVVVAHALRKAQPAGLDVNFLSSIKESGVQQVSFEPLGSVAGRLMSFSGLSLSPGALRANSPGVEGLDGLMLLIALDPPSLDVRSKALIAGFAS